MPGDDGVVRPNYIYDWGTGTPQRVEFNEPINFPDVLEGEGFYYAEFDAPVSERFVDSDTVKGLKELRTDNYYSVFSRAFEIIYTYTARDGLEKQYKLTGSEDSFDDFELYVIEHTPYVRTLAGDTVWDTDNLVMYVDDYGMHAFLNEVPKVRGNCLVKIIENINDVTAIQRYLAELEALEGVCFEAADVNQDGTVDIADATALQRYLAEYEMEYPIGELMTQ